MLELACREPLCVNVGKLLELQCTLKCDWEANVTAEEEHRRNSTDFLGHVDELIALSDDLVNQCRDGLQLFKLASDLIRVLSAACLGQSQSDQVVCGNLRQERLGCSNTDLRAGVRVEHGVRLTRNLCTVGITDSQHAGALALCVPHGLEGVRSLTRLRNSDHQRLAVQHRIAVAELGRDLNLDRDTNPVLNGVLGQQTGVVCGTTGDDEDLLDVTQILVA